MEELERCSCNRAYHVYKDKWDPVVGEILACKRESTNAQDFVYKKFRVLNFRTWARGTRKFLLRKFPKLGYLVIICIL